MLHWNDIVEVGLPKRAGFYLARINKHDLESDNGKKTAIVEVRLFQNISYFMHCGELSNTKLRITHWEGKEQE